MATSGASGTQKYLRRRRPWPRSSVVLTLRQRRTDPRLLGRVLAVSMSLNFAGTPVGSALGGMLVGGSLVPALALGALAAALGALATLAIPRDRMGGG
jgi:hypothetical protein